MSIVKVAAKAHKKNNEIAKYTPGGAVMSPWTIGASLGGIAGMGAAIAGKGHLSLPLGLIGSAAGLGAGLYNLKRQKEKGEFKKKTLKGYKGTTTGWGAWGSSLVGPAGTGIYHAVKAVRHADVNGSVTNE